MTACGTDYLSKDWSNRSYIVVYSFLVYFAPLLLIVYSYFFIVKVSFNIIERKVPFEHIVCNISFNNIGCRSSRDNDEGAGKKMNVVSLRSLEAAETSAECKLAKVFT